jgi:hypothetical protein
MNNMEQIHILQITLSILTITAIFYFILANIAIRKLKKTNNELHEALERECIVKEDWKIKYNNALSSLNMQKTSNRILNDKLLSSQSESNGLKETNEQLERIIRKETPYKEPSTKEEKPKGLPVSKPRASRKKN